MPSQRLSASKSTDIRIASALLLRGELVAFPTETVYGLGALGLHEKAIQKVYDAKKRPNYNPLIMHVASAQEALGLFKLESTELFWELAKRYWPGPLTLVAPKADHVPSLATGGLDKVAVRVPAHPVALELLSLVGQPLVAPSANASTRPSSTTAGHVLLTLGDKISAVLDAGPCEHGLESTVLDISCDPPVILRLGALNLTEYAFSQASGTQGSPGRTDKHYAPLIPEIRWATLSEIEHAPMDVSCLIYNPPPCPLPQGERVLLPNNPVEYGKALFATLYQFEQAGVQRLWIEELPQSSGWGAIRDRINRAITTQ